MVNNFQKGVVMDNEPKKEEQKPCTPQEFADKYQKLCEECGYRIVVSPAWIARDDGTFSLVLQHSVGKLSEKQG